MPTIADRDIETDPAVVVRLGLRLFVNSLSFLSPIAVNSIWCNLQKSLSLSPFGLLFSLIAAYIAAPTAAQAQNRFNDVEGHWAQSCIARLGERRILNGYSDGSFRPNAAVTRAEFATLVDTVFASRPAVRDGGEFTDVRGHWATSAIRSTYQRGFLTGYPNNRFRPNEKIPRVQALAALASGLKYETHWDVNKTLTQAFTDAATIPAYAQTAIAAATERRIVVNAPSSKVLNPDREATRAEIAAFFCQVLVGKGTIPASAVPSQYISTAPIPEIRGVWLTNIDSDVLFSTVNLRNGMRRLARLNLNTVYPTVWNWGYTLYPSAVAAGRSGTLIDPHPGFQGRDMLAEAIAEGKRNNLRVIPWFEFGFMAPSDSELAKRNPTWLTSRRDGTKTKMEGEHERVWLNPFHPDVQQFILDLAVEIVSNYEVDGIQFDDHMGLPVEFGYDEFTVQLYKQEHNGKLPPENKDDPDWVRWRADKITAFMKRVFQAIKQANPDCIVAVSPNPQAFAYSQYLQDWKTWEQQGLVEELFVQIYRNDSERFISELEQDEVLAARKHIPVGIGILTGLKGRSISVEQIHNQVAIVRNLGFSGVSFFFYESMWLWASETPEQREAAFRQLFPLGVEAPDVL